MLGLNEVLVPLSPFFLPAGLGRQAQRQGRVIGLVVESGKLAIEPLIQLGVGKAFAELVVQASCLGQAGLGQAQLQAGMGLLFGISLQLGVDLGQLKACLFKRMGPLGGASGKQVGAVQVGSVGALFIGNALGRRVQGVKSALVAHAAVGGAKNIRYQHRQPRAGLCHGGGGVPARTVLVLLGGLGLGRADASLELLFEERHPRFDHAASCQQRLLVPRIELYGLGLLLDGQPRQVPGLLLLGFQVLGLLFAFEQRQ